MPRKKPKPPDAAAPDVAPGGNRDARAGVGWLRLTLVPSVAAGTASARFGSASNAGAPRVYLHASDMQDAAVGAGELLCVMGAAGDRAADAGAAVVVGSAWPCASVRRGQAVILPPRWSIPLFHASGSAAGPRDARGTGSVDVIAWRAHPHASQQQQQQQQQQLGVGGADRAESGAIRDAATLSVALLDRPTDELEADDGAWTPTGGDDAEEPARAEPSAATARTEAAVSAAALGSIVCAPTEDGVARSFVPFALRGRRRRAVVLDARPSRQQHLAAIANTGDGGEALDSPPSAASPVFVRVQIPVGLQAGDEVVIALPTGLVRSRVPSRGADPPESAVDVPLPASVRAIAADASSSLSECAHALPDLALLRVTTETKVVIVGSTAEESSTGPFRQDSGIASADVCLDVRAIHRDGPGHEFIDRAHEVVAVGGLEDARRELRELVLLPLKRPRLYSESFGVPAPRGALLHGPRGTGEWARSAREAWLSNDTPRARAGASAPPQANPRCSTSSRRMRCRCLLRLSKAVARVRSRRLTETTTTRLSRSCGCAPTIWSPSHLETARTMLTARRSRRRVHSPQRLLSRRRRSRPSFCLTTRTVCSLHNLVPVVVAARRRPLRLALRPYCNVSAARCARHAIRGDARLSRL